MSTCITTQMWKESINKEKKRLKRLEEEGFEIQESWNDLMAMDKAWDAKDEEAMVDAVATQDTSVKPVDEQAISRLNENTPRRGKAKITVKSGYVDSDGRVMYNITYPNGTREYTVNAVSLTADQVDPKQVALGATQDDKMYFTDEMHEVDAALTSVEAAHRLIDDLVAADAKKDSAEHVQHMKDFVEGFVGKGLTENVSNYIGLEGTRTAGRFTYDVDTEVGAIEVVASKKPRVAGNELSAANKWVHELGHAVTEFALNRKDPETRGTMRRLRELRDEARKTITPEMLMPKVSINKDAEMKIAEDLWDYMFSNEVSGESEFLVHAVTNKEVIDALKTMEVYQKKEKEYANIFENIADKLRQLLGFVVRKWRDEPKKLQGDALALKLVQEIAKANNKTANNKRNLGLVNTAYEKLADWEDGLREFVEKHKDKLKGDKISVPPINTGKYELSKWFVKNSWKFMIDDRYRPGYELFLSTVGAKPEGLVQSWLRRMSESDNLADVVEQLDALSQQVDARRETTESIMINNIVETFDRKLSQEEMDALTIGVLSTDIASIRDRYSDTDLVEMLTNDKRLGAEIGQLKRDIKNKANNVKDYNWMTAQATGLGFYMATGIDSEVQALNAHNIVSGFGRNSVNARPDAQLIKLVDEMATLEALKYTDKDVKNIVADLVKNEADGMKNFVGMHKAFKEESSKKLFHGDAHREVKGYIKDIYNGDVSIEMAPISDKKEMLQMGYKLDSEITSEAGTIGIFVHTDQITPRYNKQATRLTDAGRMGTTLTDLGRMFGEDPVRTEIHKTKAQIQAKKLMKHMENGTYDPAKRTEKSKLSPMYNAKGQVVNFRYMMNKTKKRSLLEQDVRGPLVLGRMFASMQDKVETKDHNEMVVKAIRKDYTDNMEGRIGKFGRNGKEYMKLGPNSSNPEVKDLWAIIPKEVKNELKDMAGKGKGTFVRRDMLHMYFGNRDMSIINAPLMNKLGPRMKHLVRQAELMWQELMKLVKVEIIIKTPAVIIGNVLSNFLYGVMSGNNPVEVAKLQLDAIKDMREFMNLNRELIDLEIAKRSGNVKGKDVGKIPLLKETISKHPMKEFASEGLFQAIVEDVGINELKSSNKITDAINSKFLDKLPESAKTGMNWLYLTERTSFFKVMTAATQLSDAAARKAKMDLDKRRYDRLVAKGTSKKEAIKKVFLVNDDKLNELRGDRETLMSWDEIFKRIQIQEARDAFVNYSGDDRVTKYANDMGLIMFSKYLQRIQKVIKKGALSHPMNFMAVLLGQHFITGDLDTIDDKWYDMPFSPDYLDRALDLAVPAAFDLMGDVYKVAT